MKKEQSQLELLRLNFNQKKPNALEALFSGIYEDLLMPMAKGMLQDDRQARYLNPEDLVATVFEALAKEKGEISNVKAYARKVMHNRVQLSVRNQKCLKRGHGFKELSIHSFDQNNEGGES